MFGILCQQKNKKQRAVSPTHHQGPLPDRDAKMKFRYSSGDQPLTGFTIKRGVGTGGFGEVYFATNDAGKEVAIKQIQRNMEVEVRGVRQCMNLKHPNLISLFDIRFDDTQQCWIVMEYVGGPSLRDVIESHPSGLPRPELLRWFGQISAGVAYLHDHGIVHRDLKPANIFEDEGVIKIGDYGLSKFISCSRRGGQTESVGTFHYMAPEIGRGEYGKEVDVYALGVILYEIATGVVPFDGESSQEIIMKHLTANPDLSRVASPIREVVAKALAKNPASRFQDVREMLRPLGLDVDDRGQLTHIAPVGLPPLSAELGQPAPAAFPIGMGPAAPIGVGPVGFHPAVAEPVAGHHYGNPPQVAAQNSQPYGSNQVETTLHFQEPVARAVRNGVERLNRWYSRDLNSSTRLIVGVVAIIALIANVGWVMPLVTMGLMFYIPYYILWWLLYAPPKATGSQQQPGGLGMHPGQAMRGQPVVPPAHAFASPPMAGYSPHPVVQRSPEKPKRPKPMTLRQWKLAKRNQLAHVPSSQLWSQITGSWLGAAAVVSVFSFLAGLFLLSNKQPLQPVMMAMLWTSLVSLSAASIAILLGKIWQRSEGDWPLRSFIQLTSGFAVGLVAYFAANYLMVWPALMADPSGHNLIRWGGEPIASFNFHVGTAELEWIDLGQWSAFTDGNNIFLPAYLAYFPLMMGLIGWWKQVDPLRRVRFSIWSVAWSVMVASLIHVLVPFPQPWCALLAAGTSIAVQLASPWINSEERLQMLAPEDRALA